MLRLFLFIFGIVVVTLWRYTDPTAKIWLSFLDRYITHTPRGHKAIYYSYNEGFWKEQDRLPGWSTRGLRKQGRWLAWSFIVVRKWGWSKGSLLWTRYCVVWILCWHQEKELMSLLIAFPDVCKREMWGMEVERYQHANIKNGIRLIIKIHSWYLTNNWKCHGSFNCTWIYNR